MTELEEDFVGSLRALLVRYDVSLVHVTRDRLAFGSNREPDDSSKFVYIPIEDLYNKLKQETFT
jgi:hypothetical protein